VIFDGQRGSTVRELIADLFVTVDGYARGRNSPAFFGYPGPDLDAWIDDQLGRPHVLVMGANTYRLLSAMADDPSGSSMTALPKIVFSRSLAHPLSWANTTLIADDVATAVPALKREPGDPLRLIGSLGLVRSLLRLGLVDRLRLMVFPQVLGASGQEPVFADLPDLNLVLNSTSVLDGRLVLLDYRPQR
jgi:dihydrofolate reductase